MAQAQTEFRLRLQLERARSLPLAVPSRVFRVIGKQEVILLLPDCPYSYYRIAVMNSDPLVLNSAREVESGQNAVHR